MQLRAHSLGSTTISSSAHVRSSSISQRAPAVARSRSSTMQSAGATSSLVSGELPNGRRRSFRSDDVAQAFVSVRAVSGQRALACSLLATVALCVTPAVFLINDTAASRGVLDMVLPMETVSDALDMLQGAFVHTILEWSSVMGSVIAFMIGLLHFHVRRNAFVPIAMALFFMCSMMDCLHTLYADHLIDLPAEQPDWVPFTWALSRGLASLTTLGVAVGFHVFGTSWTVPSSRMQHVSALLWVSVGALSAVAVGINLLASEADLPQTQRVGEAISRPFDVAPLVLFVIVAAMLIRFVRRHGSDVLVDGVIRAVIIDICVQGYMAFGSDTLFDAAFNIAHFLKAVRAVVPAISFVADVALVYSSQRQHLVLSELMGRVEGERLLDEFVTTSTHDLGTPLLAFSAGCDILSDMELPPEASNVLSMMKSASQMMSMTRSNVLNYTRIIKGMPLHIDESTVMRWDELVHSVVVVVVANGQMVSDQVSLRCSVDVRVARPMCGELKWMQQCVTNLVTNAAKFTEVGYVHIEVAEVDDNVLVTVTDTGPGVPKADRRAIFNKFAQLAASHDADTVDVRSSSQNVSIEFTSPRTTKTGMRRLGGTGVGLFSLASQISALGGQVGVRENTEQQGSVFWFTVPRERFKDPPDVAASPTGHALSPLPLNHMWRMSPDGKAMVFEMPAGDHGAWLASNRESKPKGRSTPVLPPLSPVSTVRHVLVVDDVRTNRHMLQMLLRKLSVESIDTAAHGREALDKMSRSSYDLVLMDIQMPVMDGMSATRAYRSWEVKMRPGQRMYIVALSAMTYVEDDPAIGNAGFDGFQMKPVAMDGLRRIVQKAAAHDSGASVSALAAHATPTVVEVAELDEAEAEKASDAGSPTAAAVTEQSKTQHDAAHSGEDAAGES